DRNRQASGDDATVRISVRPRYAPVTDPPPREFTMGATAGFPTPGRQHRNLPRRNSVMRTTLYAAALALWAWSPAVLDAQEKAKAPDADEANPRVWQPRTKSVAVFKNGYGFFLREGEAALHDGWFVAKEIPPAAFGTLMIFAAKQDELVDIVGSGPG